MTSAPWSGVKCVQVGDEEEQGLGRGLHQILAVGDGLGDIGAAPHLRVAALDIPCFACAPEKLPELLEQALTGGHSTRFWQ